VLEVSQNLKKRVAHNPVNCVMSSGFEKPEARREGLEVSL
jgi:hypothetical protein